MLDGAFSTERRKRMREWSPPQPSLADIRAEYDERLSDAELLLRYLIPQPDVDAMYAARAPIEPVFPLGGAGGLGWIRDVVARSGPRAVRANHGNVTVELRR